MSKNMDPAMMQQAASMMNNPAMANQAAAAMKNMTPEDMKARLNQMPAGAGGAPKPPAPTTAVAKLKASAMDVPQEVLDLVEKAEGAKAEGNASFKSGDYKAAAASYGVGSSAVAQVLEKKKLSGTDKTVLAPGC